MTDWIYDLESFPNFFSGVFGNAETRKCYTFEISDRKNDREELVAFCRQLYKNGDRLVGFNNVGFDYNLLHFVLKNDDVTPRKIFNRTEKLINGTDDEKKELQVRPKDVLIPQIDLYLIHHFNNKARATSLKVLEFNMRSDNIEDLPFPPGTKLTDEQKDIVLKYNKHDMYQTFLFYNESLEQIRFREKLTNEYKRNFLNHNDTKIGKDYFVMRLEESGVRCYTPSRKPVQTIREEIDLGQCILPYIKFERPEFNAVKDWLSKQVIRETKGVFTDILEHELGDLAQYANMRKKKKKLKEEPTAEEIKQMEAEIPMSWVEQVELKSGKTSWYWCWNIADNLNCVVDGLQYDFGTGGLHSAKENTLVESDEKLRIKSFDFSSYYPHLSIVNRVYPEHMGEGFCDVYTDVFEQRKEHAKGTVENGMLKLALNGVYGSSNDKFSPFYDPKFTMTITIGGQLTLSMLVEKLLEVPTVEILMVNTDGLEFSVENEYVEKTDVVCREFGELVGIPLEGQEYKRLCILNVNNYIGEFCED